jgi:hypothetical protein
VLSLRAVNQYYGNQHTLWNVDLDLSPAYAPLLLASRDGQNHVNQLHYRLSARGER